MMGTVLTRLSVNRDLHVCMYVCVCARARACACV